MVHNRALQEMAILQPVGVVFLVDQRLLQHSSQLLELGLRQRGLHFVAAQRSDAFNTELIAGQPRFRSFRLRMRSSTGSVQRYP